MLITCYTAIGDQDGARRVAEITFARAEKILALDRNNALVLGHGGVALAVLGQGERAREWMSRAVLIDPEKVSMRYNFACALANYLKDFDAALDMIEPVLERVGAGLVNHAKMAPTLSRSATIRASRR
jgi:adenylate cyclase